MTQGALTTYERIDLLLGLSLEQWTSLPEVEVAIDAWDLLDRLTFVVNWPLEEMRLRHLDEYALAGNMTPAQLARLGELKRIVEKHRPIIERLLTR